MSEPATSEEHVLIRKASAADAEAIRAIQAITWIDTYPNHSLSITEFTIKNYLEGAGGEKRDIRRKRILAQIMAASNLTETFVSVDEEVITGYIIPALKEGGRNVISALYVLPEFQNQGIGASLLKHGIGWHPYDADITLQVADYSAGSIAFFKRHGFIFSNRPGSDNAVEIASGIRIPEREMLRKALKKITTSARSI